MPKNVRLTKIDFIPTTISIEELAAMIDMNDDFELGDECMAMNTTLSKLEFDTFVLQLLYALNDKEKVVFLYQILRSMGFDVAHKSFQQTLHMDNRTYVTHLNRIRAMIKLMQNKTNT